jgi:tRNA(Ile)-lysidine synthase TilS/MesJ
MPNEPSETKGESHVQPPVAVREVQLEFVDDEGESPVIISEAVVATTSSPTAKTKTKPNKNKFFKPSQKLLRHVNAAVCDFEMIEPGDRILLGLSGGKDSLAMLHIMLTLQSRCPPEERFTLACATVDPGTEAFNPRPLIPYVESLGVEYHYLDENIMAMANEHMTGDSICAFCARMKRGALYTCCRKYGYNKLILAQHLDDCVESFLMSTMYNGTMRTMKASYLIDEGDVTVIRPAIYLREKMLRDFSYEAGLPVINENCPACFEAPKERNHIKKLLAREEGVFPTLYSCMRNALRPLFDPAAMDILKMIGETIDSRNKWKERARVQRAATIASGKCAPKRVDNVEVVSAAANGTSGRTIALADATEAQLLTELTARRRERIRRIGGKEVDSELNEDLTEKQLFCTAEGCQTK